MFVRSISDQAPINPQTVTDPNGVVSTLTYTAQGWLASSSTAGATVQYAYNPMGDLTKITAPDNTFLSYTYDDARRLISVTNAQGETQSYTLDAMGNRTSALLKDASGTLVRQQHRTYDELGRLLTLVSDEAIIGVQLAISPELNGTSRWTAEAIVDFARVKLLGADACGVDTYAYRLESDGLFMDGARIEPSNVIEQRSLYQVASAEGPDDTELVAHQIWLSTVISRIVNKMHPTETADDFG